MKTPKSKDEAAGPAPAGPVTERGEAGHLRHIAWVVLGIALVASTVGWFISRKLQDQASAQQLGSEAAAIRAALQERLAVYENVLHGACGLFAASVSVERKEWRAYVDRVAIENRFPGIDALGYVACVRRAELDSFVRQTRADGMPDFAVHPAADDGEDLLVVQYLEPQERHAEIIGYNLASDPERRAVAAAARDTGRATISGLMKLSGATGAGGQDGVFMLLPVYRQRALTETVEQRRASCEGFVYARFLMKPLMAEVMAAGRLPLRLRIFDRAGTEVEQVMFDTGESAPGYAPGLSDEGVVSVGGRTWVLRFDSTPAFDAQRPVWMSLGVGAGGLFASLLLFGIAWSLSHTRERAVAIANGMTARLRRANEQLQREIVDREKAQRSIKDSEALYHSLVQSLPLNIVRKDMEGRFTFANQRFCNETGKALPEILGRTEFDLFPARMAAEHKQEEDRITETGTSLEAVQELQLPGEELRFVQVIKTPLRNGVGEVIGLQSISWDVTDKHRIEQELQRERDLLHTLLDNVPDRIYFKDDQSHFLRVSRAMVDMFRVRDASEVIGRSDFDFFGETHARQAYEDEQRIIRTGQPVIGLVEREDMPDGVVQWALTTKMPMRDAHGRVIGTFGISRDITAMKEAEEDLREANERLKREVADREQAEQLTRDSEALYHSLVETLPMHIWRKDLKGRFTFANQRFCDEVGRPLPEILGKTVADLFPAAEAARQRQAELRIMQSGVGSDEVQEYRRSDTDIRYVESIQTPLRDGAGNVIGLQGIFWDVTDKHRVERELQHERFLLHTLMEYLPDRIYFKDRNSRFVRNSRAHLRSFGLADPSQAMGKSDFDFFTQEHARAAFADEQRLMQSGEAITKEERLSYPDGSVTWALSTKMPLWDETGQIIGTFGISRDITDRKRAEEATLRAKEAAEEANRTKSQFLANMSHELRTPLNSIIGFSNILLKNRDGRLAASDLSFLGRILANGKHLLDLINQILDLSKIEARKIEVLWSSVDVGQLVRQTLEQQEGLVRDRPVQLRAELPPDLAPMRSDPDKLKQILINLIGNALKFTEQGSVTVRVLADPQTRQPRRLDVVDTGLGIPADKLGVIFQAFQQADATTARRFGGTGLGLTISQALCHLLGYRIEVTSEVGKGSSFSVVLSPPPGPAVNEPTASLPPPRDDVTPDGVHAPEIKGKRVLIIDDEADSRLLLRHMLREFGAEVFEAAAGVDGLRLARQVRPDLITVDLMMPGMTGAEVVGAIKGDPELREIPVVVVSIVSREQRGSILGVVDLLQKPIVREELLAALQRNLRPSQHRLLVVDDEADARVLMHSLLEAEHYHVLTAGSGREAWEILHRLPCDLVLLDLMMPETDGFTFLKQLRSDPGYRRVPVVVVTAKELTRQEIDELKGGASDVLQKSAALEQELKEVLHRIFAEPPGKASAASGPRSAGQPSGGS